ncbi:glycosyltransferase family 2 protein [Aestuariicoccus sp. MJ-SS9]|uniref:glycosyltransferase family 2 protein n=1 Tax=Aestuariicoccus sp. MJ-SS9 TaxID=3079855 RepID=UPI002914CADE|nr:glycosyltransferase family 2 protein [Aestuariicoccus sp. MJ-SS9]MDU8910573.1 glycosyltransferase family 2 protein [Aestuariicoccus sp. MJ-SS9]
MSSTPTYKGGIKAILAQMEARRDPLTHAPGEGLPGPDTDLAALRDKVVADPEDDPGPPYRSSCHRKRHALRREFAGMSELAFLNALLIAHLRKREAPPHAAPLFRRIWAEEAQHLLHELDARWLVSSVTTFGEHGATPAQRATGLALNVLFGTMKLYETERLYSGLSPDRPFSLDNKARASLPLQMDAYALADGGLDVNMLGRLWTEAAGDTVIRPLAHHLIEALIHDPNTLFRRLATMRQRKARRQSAGARPKPRKPANAAPVPAQALPETAQDLRWGLVSTVKAPLPQIAHFAAHHLSLGAATLHLYLDDPDPDTAAFLRRHPALRVTECTGDWWTGIGKPRPDAHQLRQAHNATRALRDTGGALHWLGHIDADEFLLADRPLADILFDLPDDTALARLHPAEALATDDGLPQHFKLTHKAAGVPRATLQDVYPTFGLHLYGGFLSHTTGKVFARPGIPDTRLGIHTLKYQGQDATNRSQISDAWLTHFHAPSWDHFIRHYRFRREAGSYRPREDREEMGLAELLAFLEEEDGEAGLRTFFDEVCADTPALRDRLARHGMLLTHRFDPDAAVRRIFGTLP